MTENPLAKLVAIRQNLYSWIEKQKQPVLNTKDEEIFALKKANFALQERVKSNEDFLAKNLNAMRYEIENREKEIFRLKQEIYAKEAEKILAQKEVGTVQELLRDSQAEKEEIIKFHNQEISDLRLKHEQEIYILKKMKKNWEKIKK